MTLRRSPLARQSEKAKKRLADEQEVRNAIKARSRGRCELQTPVCTGVAVDIHHRQLAKHAGPMSLANCRATCVACHRHAHSRPAEAYEQGWLLHPWDDPEAA